MHSDQSYVEDRLVHLSTADKRRKDDVKPPRDRSYDFFLIILCIFDCARSSFSLVEASRDSSLVVVSRLLIAVGSLVAKREL